MASLVRSLVIDSIFNYSFFLLCKIISHEINTGLAIGILAIGIIDYEIFQICAAQEAPSPEDVFHDSLLEEGLRGGRRARLFAGDEQGREAATRGHDLHGARGAGAVVDKAVR